MPILDRLGPDHTLVRFDPAVDVADFLAAATDTGLPIVVVAAERPADTTVFAHPLLIVRPDQHVAWRGDHLPTDPDLIDRVRGRLA